MIMSKLLYHCATAPSTLKTISKTTVMIHVLNACIAQTFEITTIKCKSMEKRFYNIGPKTVEKAQFKNSIWKSFKWQHF